MPYYGAGQADRFSFAAARNWIGPLTIHSNVAILERVDKRTFIHVFLIAALCFSQLAANVHMVGHFQDSPEVNFASFTTYSAQSHSHTVHHHSHRTVAEPAWEDHAKKHHLIAEHTGRIYGAVSDNSADNDNHAGSDSKADCAIYHAYLGQSGCLPASTTGFSVSTRGIAVLPTSPAPVAKLPHYHQPIRGPPLLLT